MKTMVSLHAFSNRISRIAATTVTMAICLAAHTFAQDNTYPVKTSAKPNDLTTYEVNETDGKISLLFTKKGKKHEIYSNYVFDQDLNLIAETEEELDVEQVKKKNYWSSGLGLNREAGGIIRDSVLSVDNSIFNGLVLMNGYIGWRSTTNPMNGSTITSQGFVYRQKITVKAENGRKLIMAAFQTDAPAEFFDSGKSVSGGRGRSTGMGDQKRVSASTGDVMVVSFINSMGMKDEETGKKIFGSEFKYLAQRFSAKTLEKIAETPFEFTYSYSKLHSQTATDGSNDMLMIFAPTRGATKDYSNPNKNEYVYMRIGVDTKIKERITFNSPYGRLNNIAVMHVDNETVIFGTSEKGNESKFASFVPYTQKDDHLVAVVISNGNAKEAVATPIKSLAGIAKGGTAFAGKSISMSSIVRLPDNSFLIAGQGVDSKDGNNTYGDLHCFALDGQGNIKANYVVPQTEKMSEKGGSPLALTLLNDGSVLWDMFEYTKKGNMYPKYVRITDGQLGSIVYPGNKQYVVNDKFSSYISPNKKELIYFGNTEDNKQFWLHKESL